MAASDESRKKNKVDKEMEERKCDYLVREVKEDLSKQRPELPDGALTAIGHQGRGYQVDAQPACLP